MDEPLFPDDENTEVGPMNNPPPQLISNSIWLIRDIKKPFTENGIAIEFLPHGLKFNIPAQKNFKLYGIPIPYNSEYKLLYYPNNKLLERCDFQVLTEKTETITIEGKIIETEDVKYAIPAGAVSSDIKIEIRKLNLTNCKSAFEGLTISVKADLNSDGIISIDELISFIEQWINNKVVLHSLILAINDWITDGNTIITTPSSPERPLDTPETGLIAYFDFDNDKDTTIFDTSGNKHDGLASGNGIEHISGKKGMALKFADMADIVNIPPSSDFNFGTGEFTLRLWVKIPASALTEPQHIIGKRDNTGGGNWVRFFTNEGGKLVFEFTNGNSISTDLTYADDSWHHIALTRDATGKAMFYLDDRSRSDTITSNVDNTADFTLGKWNTERSFLGEIDEVKVYNKALTADEVSIMFNAEK